MNDVMAGPGASALAPWEKPASTQSACSRIARPTVPLCRSTSIQRAQLRPKLRC